jgi:outer membrane protein TolC
MIDSGLLAKVELAAAEAELERRRDTYLASTGTHAEIENALKQLISSSREDPIWSEVLIPQDAAAPSPDVPGDWQEAVRSAIARRVELRQMKIRGDNIETERELARDQLKPQLNLTGGYYVTGLAGSASTGSNPFGDTFGSTVARVNELSRRVNLPDLPSPSFGGVPASLVGGGGTSLSNMFTGNFPTLQAGIRMDWHTRNRTAEANLAQTVIASRRLELERSRVEQAIAVQIRNSMQSLRTAAQRIHAADASVEAARQKFESEIRLFQNGESTNFLVLTRQNELSDSRYRALVARLDYNKAAARFRQAMGVTLDTYNLQVAIP